MGKLVPNSQPRLRNFPAASPRCGVLWQDLAPAVPFGVCVAKATAGDCSGNCCLQHTEMFFNFIKISGVITFKRQACLLSFPIDSNYTCLTEAETYPVSFAQGLYLSLGWAIKAGSLLPALNIWAVCNLCACFCWNGHRGAMQCLPRADAAVCPVLGPAPFQPCPHQVGRLQGQEMKW